MDAVELNSSSEPRVSARGLGVLVAGVSLAWVAIGVVLGSQTALGMTMQGNPVVVSDSIRTAWINNLPWIPATLIAIGLAVRFPVERATWARTLPLHIAAIPVVSWVANLGVVLGFWMMAGSFSGLGTLARQAAFWGTVRIHVAAFVYALTVALTQGWIWSRDSRERKLRLAQVENQLARARFQALNAQIRPHFLFNTLHTIGQLWRSGRAEQAEAMLDRLGSLFQRVRTTTESSGIPLRDELSMVEDYLAIEQARFADRLRVSVRAEPATASCLIPPLLLQPLVENAIRHGVSLKEDAGWVSVDATVADGVLVIAICDDGPGLDAVSTRPGTGTGLSNTRDRLRHAYGAEASLSLEPIPDGGVCATVRLPARRDPDHDPWEDR